MSQPTDQGFKLTDAWYQGTEPWYLLHPGEKGTLLENFAPYELVSPPEGMDLPQHDGSFVSIRPGPITPKLIDMCNAGVRTGAPGLNERFAVLEDCYSNTLDVLLASPSIEIRPMSTQGGQRGVP